MQNNNFIVSNGIISQAAFMEAKELHQSTFIPENFSNDKALQDFAIKSLESNQIDPETYEKLVGQLDLSHLEYDEAVLLGVLELISLSE